MNKLGVLFFFILTFSLHTPAQFTDFPNGTNEIPKSKLKGVVHTVLTTTYHGERAFTNKVEVYDLKGRLIEMMVSDLREEHHSGSLVNLGGKNVYIYDESGKRIKEKHFTLQGRYTRYKTYIYDAENRLIAITSYDTADKETGKTTYVYFPERREVEVSWNYHNYYIDENIPPPHKNILSYNEKAQWTKRIEFGSGNKPERTITFEYDKDGNFIKETACCESNYSHGYSYTFDR